VKNKVINSLLIIYTTLLTTKKALKKENMNVNNTFMCCMGQRLAG
jgi:hypothetical protein